MPSSPPSGRVVRVLLADDQPLFAESLMSVLSEDERVDVVGIAANGQEAIKLAADLRPDVILMDIRMPLLDGLEAARRIRASGLPVQIILITGTDSAIGDDAAAEVGATAFLRKERGVEELRRVFLEVASLASVLGQPAH